MSETPIWHKVGIAQIEDLGNAVLGADLEPVQMAGPRVSGSLAFSAHGGVVYTSGLIDGRVTISGPLSYDAITLGVGLKFGRGSRHWLNKVAEGDVGIFLPGDSHDAYYTAGTLYLAATLTRERLEQVAASEGLVLDRKLFSRTGPHSTPVDRRFLFWLGWELTQIHNGNARSESAIGSEALRFILRHCSHVPSTGDGRVRPQGRARVVGEAREYIRENLSRPITVDDLTEATGCSRRSLYRAFKEVFDERPYNYILRLRLHRIRHDLVSDAEAKCSIALVAKRWGFREPGRFSGWYKELFGEIPSQTRLRSRAIRDVEMLF